MIELVKNETHDFKKYGEFKSFLDEEDSKKSEQLVEFRDWKLTENGLRVGKKEHKMRESGMSTLLKTFGMPQRFYFEKAPSDMLVRDVNRMKREYTEDSEMMVFFSDDEIRAIAGPNTRHAERTRSVLDNYVMDPLSFKMASYNDLGMRVTTRNKSDKIKVTKDDIMNTGVDLIYSDVGYHRTMGSPFILRLVCTNGLVVKEKSNFLNTFSMAFKQNQSEDNFLDTLRNNIAITSVDVKTLKNIFKAMKDNEISKLSNGEAIMKKIRSAIGTSKFDEHEKLSVKVMTDDENEKHVVNTELPLYDALDVTTRLAKRYDTLGRRRIEILAGNLVVESGRQFLSVN